MSGIFNAARDAFARGVLSWTDNEIRAQLVSQSYAFDERHRTIDDVAATVGEPIGVRDTAVADGWLQCGLLNFAQVSGASVVAILFYRESDGLLIELHTAIDTFPMKPNGGDVEVLIAQPGIFRI